MNGIIDYHYILV